MSLRLLMAALAVAGLAAAQDPPSRAGRISYISGPVSFDPAGVPDWTEATVNRPLTTGDQLYADSGARAEVHIPGAALRLGDRSAFEFMNLDDQNAQIRLSEGVMDLRVRNLYGNIEVDTPNVAFTVSSPGEYRIDVNADSGQTLVTARSGQGQVIAGGGSFNLNAGQQAAIMGQGASAQYQINQAPGMDGFDQWVTSRNASADRYARGANVSEQMVGYEDLGQYGTWRATPDYGQVWVPNGVAAGWAPYHDGHWAWIDPWGWTWVDQSPWGFAPFHYGRWAFVNGYWGWCPGPAAQAPMYAPALVAWVGGFGVSVGGGDAVGWFPLGPRDVYIPSFGASAAFVTRINVTNTRVINTTVINNTYNTYIRTNAIPVGGYMNRGVANAVVAVPQSAFISARPVQQVAIHMQANQLASMKAAGTAPRVAPQVASVLGRPAGGSVARPPAAVLARPIVAKMTPPAPPPSFQQRQTVLAKNPGRPIPVTQLHQMAASAPAAARPQVNVQTNVHPINPQAAHAGAPVKLPSNTQPKAAPSAPAQASGTNPKPFEPPNARQPATQAAHQPAAAAPRPFEPPAARQPATQAARQPMQPPAAKPIPNTPRAFEPPVARPAAHAPAPARPAAPQSAQRSTPQTHAAAPQAERRAPPPARAPQPQPRQAAPSRPAPQVQPARPAPAPKPQATPKPQPAPKPPVQPKREPPPERKPENR